MNTKNYNNSISMPFGNIIRYALILIVFVVILLFIKPVISLIKNLLATSGNSNLGQNDQNNPSYNNNGGRDYSALAKKINDAFWNYGWFSSMEDEETAISTLQIIEVSEIKKLGNAYTLLGGHNLEEDFRNYIPDTDSEKWGRVSKYFD